MSHVKSSTFIAAWIENKNEPGDGLLTDLPFLEHDPSHKKFYEEENGDPVIFLARGKELPEGCKLVSYFDDYGFFLYNILKDDKNFIVKLGYAEIPKPIAHRATFHGSGVAQPSSWVDGPGPWPKEVNDVYSHVTYEYAYPAGDGRDDIIAYKVSPAVPWKHAGTAIPYYKNIVYGYALKKKKIAATPAAEPEATEPSNTTKALQELLAARDAMGRKKYGTSLDRTDLTATECLNHMLEELLDGAGYAMRAIEGIKRIETKLKNLEALLKENKS